MSAKSAIFSPRELRTLERLGDIMLPRHGETPSFSEVGCIEHIDSIAQYAPADDIASLRVVLRLLSFAPNVALRALLRATHNPVSFPEPLESLLRLLNFAFRGLLCTLYYSGKTGAQYTGPTPLERLGFSLNRVPREGVDGSG